MSRNTIARINLAAVRYNLKRVRELAPDSAVACVVKADAYGHGLTRICAALDDADVLAVATTGEAALCRQQGWSGRLLLLEGPSNVAEFDEMIALEAETVVHHETQLQLLRQRKQDVPRALWLKIDTGMHRLGFPEAEARAAHAELEKLRGSDPITLMTHFACADDLSNPLTVRQIKRFESATAGLSGPVSLANSAGMVNFRESQRDCVRPGIMLYGISPCQGKSAAEIGLTPAMTLQCDLIAINSTRAGDTVGYGASFTCPTDMRIGVGAIGYGDGYPRQARNGTPLLVNGRKAALVGHVSMDMITIDLSGHDDAKVGDPVTLWGSGLPIEEVASWSDSIPYELICGVTARVLARVE
ncbi:MAG TPA: alanine racemase [Xanthomonadales bacterium]|nr:alanine racemase [Xanthomonadales bacterium]